MINRVEVLTRNGFETGEFARGYNDGFSDGAESIIDLMPTLASQLFVLAFTLFTGFLIGLCF